MLYEIHRYPAELIDVVHVVRDGRPARIVVRPVLPQDDEPTRAFFARLSVQARRDRFMSPVRDVPPGLINRFTHIDYRAHVALVAEVFEGGVATVIAEVRYVLSEDGGDAEFAVTVAEAWQRLGLARLLLSKLVCHAEAAGVRTLKGQTLASNTAMLTLAGRAGFQLTPDPELRSIVLLERVLPTTASRAMPCGADAA